MCMRSPAAAVTAGSEIHLIQRSVSDVPMSADLSGSQQLMAAGTIGAPSAKWADTCQDAEEQPTCPRQCASRVRNRESRPQNCPTAGCGSTGRKQTGEAARQCSNRVQHHNGAAAGLPW